MPWVIQREGTGQYMAGIDDNEKVNWTKKEGWAWQFGDKALTKPYMKILRGQGYIVGAFGYTVRPKKEKEEKKMAVSMRKDGNTSHLYVQDGGKCKPCGKKKKPMFAFEAWDPHEFVLVCSGCIFEIVSEHLASENE